VVLVAHLHQREEVVFTDEALLALVQQLEHEFVEVRGNESVQVDLGWVEKQLLQEVKHARSVEVLGGPLENFEELRSYFVGKFVAVPFAEPNGELLLGDPLVALVAFSVANLTYFRKTQLVILAP
jgi:hypothetical protein